MPGLGATDPADLEAQACAELSFSRRPMYFLLSLLPTVIQVQQTAKANMMGQVVAVNDDVIIIPLCVPLDAADDNNIAGGSSSTSSSFRIVGTVTLRGQSAVVWFGWGGIEKQHATGTTTTTVAAS